MDRHKSKQNQVTRDTTNWEERRGWMPSPGVPEDVRHGSFEREHPPFAVRRESFEGTSPSDLDPDFPNRGESSRSYTGGASSVVFASGALIPSSSRGIPRRNSSKRKTDPDVIGSNRSASNAETRESGGGERGSERSGAGADILVRGPIHRPARTEQQRAEAAEKRMVGGRSPMRTAREPLAMRELEQKVAEMTAGGPTAVARKVEPPAEDAPAPPPPSRSTSEFKVTPDRVLSAPSRMPPRNVDGWSRQTVALLSDETSTLGDKLGDERRARSFLEYSLLEAGLELPNIEAQELKFEEVKVETTVAWLKSELQALRLHLKLLQSRLSEQMQEAKAEAGLQAKHTEELLTVQTHLDGQLDWTKNSFDLERQLNDQLEEMLADSEIDVEAMVAFLGLTEAHRSGTVSPEVTAMPERWADGIPTSGSIPPSEATMSALSSGSSTPLNNFRWRRGNKGTSGVLAPNSNSEERRGGRKASMNPHSNPNMNPSASQNAALSSQELSAVGSGPGSGIGAGVGAGGGSGSSSELVDLGLAVEMRLRNSLAPKERRAAAAGLLDRGAATDVWDQGKAERALQQANWERPHRGGKERLKGAKPEGKSGAQGTSSGGGGNIMMALFDKKLRKGKSANALGGAGAGIAPVPDLVGRPNDLVEEMIRCLLATYCRQSVSNSNDPFPGPDIQVKPSKSSMKGSGFSTPNPSNPVTPRFRESPDRLPNAPLPPPFEPTPPPQGSSGSWWSKSSRSKSTAPKERVVLPERTPPGTPPMTPPHPAASQNIMHLHDPLPMPNSASSWAARKGPLPNLQGTRSPTKVGTRTGALARMQTLSEAELQEAREDVAGWANIPTAAAAAAHFQSRGRSDVSGSGPESEECSASSSPMGSPPRGASGSGAKGRGSAKEGGAKMDVGSIREEKEWETAPSNQWQQGRGFDDQDPKGNPQSGDKGDVDFSLFADIPTQKPSYGRAGVGIDLFVSQLGLPVAPVLDLLGDDDGDADADVIPNASLPTPSRHRPVLATGSMDENDPVFMAAARLSRGDLSLFGRSSTSVADASGGTDSNNGGGGHVEGTPFDEQGDVEQALRDISLGRSLSARDQSSSVEFGSGTDASIDTSNANSGSQEGGRPPWGGTGLGSGTTSMSEEGFLADAVQAFECRPDAFSSKDPYGIGVDHVNLDIGEYAQLLQITAALVEELRARPESPHMARFRALALQLEDVDPGHLTHEEKLAFWINVYNALLLNAFLTHGIPSTHLKRVSLMSKATFSIGGYSFNALAVEHSVLRACSHRPALTRVLPWQRFPPSDERASWVLRIAEPLVSFALCPGTRSSPALRIYSPGEIRDQLLAAKEDFLRAAVGVTKSGGSIILPKVLDWYGRDFAASPVSLLEWVARQLPPAHRSLIEPRINSSHPGRCMVVVPYDWTFRYLMDVRAVFDSTPSN